MNLIISLLVVLLLLTGCVRKAEPGSPGKPFTRQLERNGTEIMIAGQLFDIGTPVVLWTDPGGYDAYRTERRFVPWDQADWAATEAAHKQNPDSAPGAPARFGLRYLDHNRQPMLSDEELERVRGGGWDLPLLQRVVDQFVIHYDVCGVSQQCFRVLHDLRGLSVHFMLDIDGTIYQTLDLKERAWHAGIANSRSVGIEIANMGAYPSSSSPILVSQWYRKNPDGSVQITIPERLGDGGVRVPGTYSPRRNELISGVINGRRYWQYDLTQQQYDALIKLTAALTELLPEIRLDYPREADGSVINRALTPEEFTNWKGLIGHFHVTNVKQDPGPAFDWEYVVREARKLRGMR